MKPKNDSENINPQDKRFRFRKYSKEQALDVMQDFKTAIKQGAYIQEKAVTSVLMPTHVANYLLESFYLISHGVDANVALRLTGQKGGHMKDRARDADVVLFVDELCNARKTKEDAIAQAANKFFLSEEGIQSAYKRGVVYAEFYGQIKKVFGSDEADEFLEHIRRSY